MPIYGIDIKKVLKMTIIVEAENINNAIQQVNDDYEQRKIVLCENYYDKHEIIPSEKWQNGEIPVRENISSYFILGNKEKIRLNFKNLYENGQTDLTYGGKIVYEKYDGEDFFDVLQEKSPHVLLVDHEKVEVLLKTSNYVVVKRFGTNNTVWLTYGEFEMATQHNNDFK